MQHQGLVLNTVKAVGVFAGQAAIIPVRMQGFYRDCSEQQVLQELVAMSLSSPQASGGALQRAAVHVLSTLVNPYYGDTFSYPWKRGPHDNIPEYLEALPVFEGSIREMTWKLLSESGVDWLGKYV